MKYAVIIAWVILLVKVLFCYLSEIQIQLGRLYFMGQAYLCSWSPKGTAKMQTGFGHKKKKNLVNLLEQIYFSE